MVLNRTIVTTAVCGYLFLAILPWGGLAGGKTSRNLVTDPEFKEPKQWILGDGYRIDPSGGMDGQAALLVERTDPTSYVLGHTVVKLIPDRTYEIGVYIKGENVHNGDAHATLAAEFLDARGNTLSGGVYPGGIGGTFDWKLVREKMYVPPEITACRLCLYLRPQGLGKAWFCRPYVREIAGDFNAYLLCPAMPSLIQSGNRTVIFGVVPPQRTQAYQCRVELWKDNKEIASVVRPVQKCRMECQFDIPVGAFDFRLTLLENERSLGKVNIPSRGVAKIDPTIPVRIDDRGRCWVDGKKFFPIGLYFQHSDPSRPGRDLKTDLKIVAGSPFNCVMPYDGLNWGSDTAVKPGMTAVRKMLDYCKSLNVKVIFSVKDVRSENASYDGIRGESAVISHVITSLKDHPTVLAWYVNDEDPITLRPEFVARNTFINQLDSTHPTWAAFAEFNSKTPLYGGSGTVYGLDPYAISCPFGGKENSQEMVCQAMDAAGKAFGHRNGMAFWGVPQIFNWGVYHALNDPKKFRNFRYPTETEMRSMMLMMLIGGAKGMVMYSFCDLHVGPDKDQFKTRWPEICRVAQLLSDLQDYVLGDPVPVKVNIKVKSGEVRASGFTNDTNSPAIVIASIGPGASEATIHVQTDRELKSLFGRSVKLAKGTWLFKGRDIDSDVLLPADGMKDKANSE